MSIQLRCGHLHAVAGMFRRVAPAIASSSLALLVACGSAPGASQPLPCDDGIKAAFKPDANTTVVAVRPIKKGEALIAQDSAAPITAATDMCLVKLLVGPGATAETDQSARSYSEGIGIEVWLPAHANWNERIRNYGGGGWVGGGHRYPDKIGSKVPAIVNANMGYAVGHHRCRPAVVPGRFVCVSVQRQDQHRVVSRLHDARDGRAGRQDQGPGEPFTTARRRSTSTTTATRREGARG